MRADRMPKVDGEVWLPDHYEFGIHISQSAWTRCAIWQREDGLWVVEGLYVTPDYRGMGFGRKTLGKVLEWADSHNQVLTLTPTPFDNEGMELDGLASFYAKYGFTWVPGEHRMVRHPRAGSPFYG